MADLDTTLASALLQGGKPKLRSILEKGFSATLLEGDGKKAYEFILDFYKKYDALPQLDVVMTETGVILTPTTEPLDYLVDVVYERKTHKALLKGVEGIADLLDKKQPMQGRAAIERLLRELRSLDTRSALVESLPALGDKVIAHYERMKRGERGILTPWPTINETTMGFWPEDLVLFVARMGIGKCVTKSSVCVDPVTGLEHTIEEVVQRPDLQKVWSWSPDKGIHTQPITAKVDTGHKQCLKLTFSSGRSVEVTPEHPLLTADGWKRADEFKVGMTAALPAQVPLPEKPQKLPAHEVDFLALMLADGACTSGLARFTKTDPSIVSIGKRIARALGVTLTQSKHGIDWTFSQGRGVQSENPARALLRSHGLDGVLSKNKVVPKALYRLDRKQLSRFLSVFWMCDGYVDASGPCVTLASERMVRQLQSLLLRLGVQSRVEYKVATCKGTKFDSWRLRVYAGSWVTFSEEVPLWGHRADQLKKLLKKKRNPNVGFPRVSDAFVQELRTVAETQMGRWGGGGLKAVGTKLGRKSQFMFRNLFGQSGTNSLMLEPLKAFCEVYGVEDKYRWLWGSDIFWDVVESIESIGEQKIYDLSIAPTSCFIANDIILHNTWVASQLAGHAWEQGKKVLFATTEMAKERMAQRYFAHKLRLPYDQFRKGKLDSFSEQKFRDGVAALMNSPNFSIVGGDFDFSMDTFAGIVQDEKPDMVVVDGAYLMKVPGLTRTERAANVFDELKRIAKRSKACVLATMQFNREVKVNQQKTVQADAIALTDVAGWNADLIFGLIQTEDMKQNKRMAFKPLKVREGSGEEIECNWDFTLMDFSEIPKANPSGQLVMPSGISTYTGGSSGNNDDLF